MVDNARENINDTNMRDENMVGPLSIAPDCRIDDEKGRRRHDERIQTATTSANIGDAFSPIPTSCERH